MKINQIIRERSQQDDGCPPCPPATPPAKQLGGAINSPIVNKALTPHWLTNLIPGFAPTQQVAKAARDLVNAISAKDPRAAAAVVASVPGPLQAAAGITDKAMGAYDTVKKDGPGMLSKIQSYNPFRSRSGPPAPIEDRIAKPVTAQPYSQRVGEILGDTVGTVTTVPDASGKIKIKTPTGTEIETNKDALLPGAKPGTVQMKPDAAGDALKPGTQVVSAEATEELSRIKELAGVKKAEINQPAAPVAPLPQLKVPTIPQLPAQDGELGAGIRVQTNRDGTRSYSSGEGTFTYDAQGKAITYTSPKMSGYGQTLDLATNQIVHDYAAGPLQVTNKVDAQGRPITSRVRYDLGAGVADTELDHTSGIKTNTFAPRVGDGTDTAATLAAAHRILPTSAIAAARGVDPKKFAAFQKQNPTAVKEDDNIKARAKAAFDELNNPNTGLKTSSDAEIRARLAAQKGKGTNLKDMNPFDRDQWLNSTGQYWDTVTQTAKPLPVKESADDKLLQQMLSIARLR